MKREDLVLKLGRLGYTLVSPEGSKVKENEVLELLEELAESEDSRLAEGFPVVLANCAHKDMNLDFQALLSRLQSDSRKLQAMEKLLLLSSALLAQQGLDQPKNLENLSKSLNATQLQRCRSCLKMSLIGVNGISFFSPSLRWSLSSCSALLMFKFCT